MPPIPADFGPVLVVAAHHDDEVLGCGGVLARLARAGHDVHVAILGEGATCRLDDGDEAAKAALARLQQEQARRAAAILGARAVHFGDLPDNRFDSLPLLDVVRRVEALVREVGPDLVLTHHHGDLNVDHAVTARAVLTAARPLPDRTTRAVLSFEAPSSTEWAFGLPGSPFRPTLFVDIAEHLQAKLEALAAYGDEMRPFPHPRSAEAVRHLAALRGATAGRTAAEAFEILHWTM